MLKYFEGEDKVFGEAETNEMEVKQMKKNWGRASGKTPNNYPIVSRKSFTEEVAEANCYSKQDKVYHKEQSLPSEEGMDKNHLWKTSHPLRVLWIS